MQSFALLPHQYLSGIVLSAGWYFVRQQNGGLIGVEKHLAVF
jgi:hypothetical protein